MQALNHSQICLHKVAEFSVYKKAYKSDSSSQNNQFELSNNVVLISIW